MIIEAKAIRIQGLDYRSWSIQDVEGEMITECGTYSEALYDFISLCREKYNTGFIKITEIRLQNWTPFDSEKIDMIALCKEHNEVIANVMTDLVDEDGYELEKKNENAAVYASEYDQEEMDRIAQATVNGFM